VHEGSQRVEEENFPPVDPDVARQAGERHRQARHGGEIGAPRRVQKLRAREAGQGVPVDGQHLAHALGCDPVREHRGHECPGTGADVDVELAGGEVLEEGVESEERAHLVEATHDAPARECERPARWAFQLRAHR
jgi:hypothetical protein